MILSLFCHFADCPASLISSDKSVSVPVEASIEDLHDIQYDNSVNDDIQTDARAAGGPSLLEKKLDRELQYHKGGSFNCESQSYYANPSHLVDLNVRQPEQDKPPNPSSVQSWTKEPVQPTCQDETWCRPNAGLYDSMASSTLPSHFPMSASSPSLSQINQQQPHSQFHRQESSPVFSVSDSTAPELSPWTTFKSGSLQDSGTFMNFLNC